MDADLVLVIFVGSVNVAGVIYTILQGQANWPLAYRLWLAGIGVASLWISLSALLTMQGIQSSFFRYQTPARQDMALLLSVGLLPGWLGGFWFIDALRRFRIGGQKVDLLREIHKRDPQ